MRDLFIMTGQVSVADGVDCAVPLAIRKHTDPRTGKAYMALEDHLFCEVHSVAIRFFGDSQGDVAFIEVVGTNEPAMRAAWHRQAELFRSGLFMPSRKELSRGRVE